MTGRSKNYHPLNLSVIEIYSSIECPYAYLAAYRLRQIWPEFEGRVEIAWRALSLEYVNRAIYPKPLLDEEMSLFARIEPDLPMRAWIRPEWEFPTTFWPAFEALACAQAQGSQAGQNHQDGQFFIGGHQDSLLSK